MGTEHRYITEPKRPFFAQKVTVPAGIGQIKVIDLPESVVLFVAEATQYGTSAGEIEWAFGSMGDFFDMSPGDFICVGSPFGKLTLRNKTAFAKDFVLIHSIDPAFRFDNSPRGL